MNFLRKGMSHLAGRVESTNDRKPRPRRARLGSLVERLETRAMLSQVNPGAPLVGPPPGAVGPAVIVSTQGPSFNVHVSAPVGSADHVGPLDVTEGGGQIGIQLVHRLDVTEGGGQIGVQLDR